MKALLYYPPALILVWLLGLQVSYAHHNKLGNAKPVVSNNWLINSLRLDPDLAIIDVRPEKLYLSGHIPGAINIPAEKSFNPQGDKSRIATLQQIRDIFSSAGIHNDDYVVLYDDGMLKDAAHMFWVMETYGHRNVSVLDGGINAWTQDKGKLSKDIVKRPVSRYIPSISPHHMSTKLTTRLAMENEKIAILDARHPDDYLGVASSKASRKGHIPGAINIPWDANLEKTSHGVKLANQQKLTSLYAALGKPDGVITYCNRGKESAVSYLVLRNIGVSVSVYDGAWIEWSADQNLPVSTKQQPR